jgi:hypothetical protein
MAGSAQTCDNRIMNPGNGDKRKRDGDRNFQYTKPSWNDPDAIEAIRQGLLEAEQGLGQDADEFFDELEREDAKA